MKTLILLLILFTSQTLFAKENWSGSYQGILEVEDQRGIKTECFAGPFVIAHNIQKNWEGFWAYAGIPTCDLPSFYNVSTMFEIKENKIFQNGIQIGSMNNDQLLIVKSSSLFKEEISLTRINSETISISKWISLSNDDGIYHVFGNLYRD